MPDHGAEWITTTTILHDLRDAANDAAWRRFMQRFRAPLFTFVRRLGVEQADAEDIVQDVLLEFSRVYREGRYERERGRLSAWLFGIAHRCVLRHRQRRARARERLVPDGSYWDAAVDEKDHLELWNTEWERWAWEECLRRARLEFEPTTLRAFVLVVKHERPPSAAAEELGVPVKAVYNAKHRVLKRLRELRAELEGADG